MKPTEEAIGRPPQYICQRVNAAIRAGNRVTGSDYLFRAEDDKLLQDWCNKNLSICPDGYGGFVCHEISGYKFKHNGFHWNVGV